MYDVTRKYTFNNKTMHGATLSMAISIMDIGAIMDKLHLPWKTIYGAFRSYSYNEESVHGAPRS